MKSLQAKKHLQKIASHEHKFFHYVHISFQKLISPCHYI